MELFVNAATSFRRLTRRPTCLLHGATRLPETAICILNRKTAAAHLPNWKNSPVGASGLSHGWRRPGRNSNYKIANCMHAAAVPIFDSSNPKPGASSSKNPPSPPLKAGVYAAWSSPMASFVRVPAILDPVPPDREGGLVTPTAVPNGR